MYDALCLRKKFNSPFDQNFHKLLTEWFTSEDYTHLYSLVGFPPFDSFQFSIFKSSLTHTISELQHSHGVVVDEYSGPVNKEDAYVFQGKFYSFFHEYASKNLTAKNFALEYLNAVYLYSVKHSIIHTQMFKSIDRKEDSNIQFVNPPDPNFRKNLLFAKDGDTYINLKSLEREFPVFDRRKFFPSFEKIYKKSFVRKISRKKNLEIPLALSLPVLYISTQDEAPIGEILRMYSFVLESYRVLYETLPTVSGLQDPSNPHIFTPMNYKSRKLRDLQNSVISHTWNLYKKRAFGEFPILPMKDMYLSGTKDKMNVSIFMRLDKLKGNLRDSSPYVLSDRIRFHRISDGYFSKLDGKIFKTILN